MKGPRVKVFRAVKTVEEKELVCIDKFRLPAQSLEVSCDKIQP